MNHRVCGVVPTRQHSMPRFIIAIFHLLCTFDRSGETNQAPDESRKTSPVVIETGRSGFVEIWAGCSVLLPT